MTQRMLSAVNRQINAELHSAFLYLSMSMDAEAKGYSGIANWFYVQWKEEQDHARILENYINSLDQAKVELTSIPSMQKEWESAQQMFEDTLSNEIEVSNGIYELCEIADADSDHATLHRLTWFVDEQIEEEEQAREMIRICAAAETDPFLMHLFDNELSQRVYQKSSAL